MAAPRLNHHHTRILQQIFEHPMPHNIEWPDVESLLAHLGTMKERHDGKYEFHIGAVSEVFTKPKHKDVGTDELVLLRHFLTRAGITPE